MTERSASFDPAVLENLVRMLGQETVREIVERFLGHAPGLMEAVRECRRSGEAAAMAESLHSLKSSAMMLGARELEQVTETMERHAREGESGALEALHERLESSFTEALAHLRGESGRLAP